MSLGFLEGDVGLAAMDRFNLAGLPDHAVQESRADPGGHELRIWVFLRQRVTIRLAPADIRKEGAAFDLPMALVTGGVVGTVFRQAAQTRGSSERSDASTGLRTDRTGPNSLDRGL